MARDPANPDPTERAAGMTPEQAARKVIAVLHEAGHVALLAGGCVRDRLLGVEPKDYDVATDAPPQRVVKLFHRAQLVGEAFGVALARVGGQSIEIATFRQEWGYSDGRRPDAVRYTDAPHDAQRRDFTINGLFCDVTDRWADANCTTQPVDGLGTVIDYVGGLADLRARRIRAIGSPGKRFSEDYLRMLRAVRFAARLGFDIDDATATAIRLHAGKLSEISRERIGQEVAAILTPGERAHPLRAVQHLQGLQIDGPTLMEQKTEATPRVVEALCSASLSGVSYAGPLAAWLLDRHGNTQQPDASPDALAQWLISSDCSRIVRRWRKALNLSNDQTQALTAALSGLAAATGWDMLRVAHRKRLLARPCWPDVAALVPAVGQVTGWTEWSRTIARESAELLTGNVAPEPLLTGSDLIEMGMKPGPEFGDVLETAYNLQLEHQLPDRAAALQWLAEKCSA